MTSVGRLKRERDDPERDGIRSTPCKFRSRSARWEPLIRVVTKRGRGGVRAVGLLVYQLQWGARLQTGAETDYPSGNTLP